MPGADRNPYACTLALCHVGMLMVALATNLLPVLLTTLAAAFGGVAGLSNEQLGRVGAVTFVGLGLGIVLAGPLADRIGPRPFAVAGNWLIAAGLGALALASNYVTLLMAAFALGMGAGVLDMILSPIVSALQAHRRTAAMNWLHSFYCIGAVATVLVASVALRLGLDWRALSGSLALLPAVVGAGFLAVGLPALVAEAHGARMPVGRLLGTPLFPVLMAVIFLAGSSELGMAQWLPAYAEKGLAFGQLESGLALMAFSLAMAIGRVIAGWAGVRVGAIPLMLAGALAAAVLYAGGGLLPWRWGALSACVAVGLAVSTLWPSTLALAADRYPSGGATMFSLLAVAGNLGGVFMPWLIGGLADRWSIQAAITVSAAVPLVLAAAVCRLRVEHAR